MNVSAFNMSKQIMEITSTTELPKSKTAHWLQNYVLGKPMTGIDHHASLGKLFKVKSFFGAIEFDIY